ncbi:MAG: 16S rRNA (guanine(966)-N(2))-methyltransferase RsmD [Thermodesulfobacteriota bacterium]
MQVQTGIAKGKKLKLPKTNKVRPTTSRIKKSIFDKLGNLDGQKVLDLFAGSGNLGIEALSKNADSVTFVEKQRSVADFLTENIKNCGFEEQSETLVYDFNKAIKRLLKDGRKFDLILIDPPYELYNSLDVEELVTSVRGLLNSSGTIVLEHNQLIEFSDPKFVLDTKNYGGTNISFLWSVN